MEFIEGKNLNEYLNDLRKRETDAFYRPSTLRMPPGFCTC